MSKDEVYQMGVTAAQAYYKEVGHQTAMETMNRLHESEEIKTWELWALFLLGFMIEAEAWEEYEEEYEDANGQ